MNVERLLFACAACAAVSACGGSTAATAPATAPAEATSASTASASSAEVPPPSASSAPPPLPTGGSVMVGEINAPKNFDPKPTIEAMKPQLVDCYNKARAGNPDLRGKITLRIQVNEGGAVLSVDAAPGGHANDPALVACIDGAMKAGAHFPKPGGTAIVAAPLVFRP